MQGEYIISYGIVFAWAEWKFGQVFCWIRRSGGCRIGQKRSYTFTTSSQSALWLILHFFLFFKVDFNWTGIGYYVFYPWPHMCFVFGFCGKSGEHVGYIQPTPLFWLCKKVTYLRSLATNLLQNPKTEGGNPYRSIILFFEATKKKSTVLKSKKKSQTNSYLGFCKTFT